MTSAPFSFISSPQTPCANSPLPLSSASITAESARSQLVPAVLSSSLRTLVAAPRSGTVDEKSLDRSSHWLDPAAAEEVSSRAWSQPLGFRIPGHTHTSVFGGARRAHTQNNRTAARGKIAGTRTAPFEKPNAHRRLPSARARAPAPPTSTTHATQQAASRPPRGQADF